MGKGYTGPLPSPAFKQQMGSIGKSPFTYFLSGQLTTANPRYFSIPGPRRASHIVDAYFSLAESGKHDSYTLAVELDLWPAGDSSIFTTKPKYTHVSGEASDYKSSLATTDSAITAAVINTANTAVAAGQPIKGSLTITRSGAPTTEMGNVSVVVILNPDS